MSELTDELSNDLHAYVDGHLDPQERLRIEALLAGSPEHAALVAEWTRQNAAMRIALGPIAEEPAPDRVKPQYIAATRNRRVGGLMRIAASIALVGFGAAAGWFAHDRFATMPALTLTQASDLVSSALAAHRIYTVEVRHPVEVTASEEDHLVRWLSKRIGAPLVAPNLTTQGFALVGGRLLPAGGGPAAQFMYENTQGQRITLYLVANPDGHDTSFRMAESDGVNIFYWLDGPLGVAVAGPLEREALMRLVRIAYEQIDKRLEAG